MATSTCTYEEFGRRFYEIAVTEERVGDAIAAIAGDEFEMGPMGQGPGQDRQGHRQGADSGAPGHPVQSAS